VCFPTTVRIRCWFHRLANIRAKLPDEAAGEVLAHLYAVRDAPTLDAARAAADRFTNTYARDYPAAVACFTDDLDALLNIHRVSVRHRIRVRTTNLCERSFVEERRRTKVIPCFTDEKAAMKLVFATSSAQPIAGAGYRSATSSDTSSSSYASSSGLTHHPSASTTTPADTKRQQHEQQAIRYRTLGT
jgi:transposase-like protein